MDQRQSNSRGTKKKKNVNPFKVSSDLSSDPTVRIWFKFIANYNFQTDKQNLHVFEKTTASYRHSATRLKFADVDFDEPDATEEDSLSSQRVRRMKQDIYIKFLIYSRIP
jgi:hypothetical protein